MHLKTYQNKKFLLCLLISILISGGLFAQIDLFGNRDLSAVKIEDISDQDLLSLYEQAVAAGYSENDLIAAANQRGLPQSELSHLRRRLNSLIQLGSNKSTPNTASAPRASGLRFSDTLANIPTTNLSFDSSIFGSELFSTASIAFEPNLRIPAPSNYMLGPDDELIVSVYGLSERRYSLVVDEAGEVYIPNVGPVVVNGLTLEEARDRITNKLASTIYTAIRSGQTKVQITLGKIRSIRVTVIGQAKKPGTYTVSSLTTLYNLLYLSGGPTDMGSFRKIEVIRGNEKRHADLYDFLVYGSQKDNILLKEGDVVRVPYYENRVSLSGLVKRPGQYEMLEDESFTNLLAYAGGFRDNAYRGEVSVERITDSVRKVIDLRASGFSSFIVKGSDKFFVKRLGEEFGNRLFVTGSVQRPGPYELTPGITVRELIEKAGGLTPDAFRTRALIYRYLPNKIPTIESVNLDSVFSGEVSVTLQKNDSLVVGSLFSFRSNESVTVQGNVRSPVQIGWRDGLTLKDALFAAGGIGESGDSTNIEVSRRVTAAKVESSNYIESNVITIDLKNSSAPDIALHPFDVIIVKEKPGYSVQRSVVLSGEVRSPGIYILEKRATKISEVLERSGGFRGSADSSSLTIRRIKKDVFNNEERQQILSRILASETDSSFSHSRRPELDATYDIISVNLKNILEEPESPENLQLEDGDILTVDRSANLVKVSGEVYFPTLVAYKPNKNLKYYIKQAGNFMPQARKSGALVINPNGTVESVKQFLFFKSYPTVSPRSEIFVPVKDKSNRSKLGATEWAVIVSALGILSNVVINLTK